MNRRINEENISGGFRLPPDGVEYTESVTTLIPECNICKFQAGIDLCSVYGSAPAVYSDGKRHDCPKAILESGSFLYPEYEALYPDGCRSTPKE